MTDPTPQTPAPEKAKTRQMVFSTLDDGTVRIDFDGLEPLNYSPAAMPDSIFPPALTKGMNIRLQGYASGLTGDARTPEALREAVQKGIADLSAGIWATERAPGSVEISIEAEAAHLFRVKRGEKTGQAYTGSLADSAAAFAALPEAKQKELKETGLYKTCYAQVKADRATAKAAKMAKKADGEDFDF